MNEILVTNFSGYENVLLCALRPGVGQRPTDECKRQREK